VSALLFDEEPELEPQDDEDPDPGMRPARSPNVGCASVVPAEPRRIIAGDVFIVIVSENGTI
jgi:hypothetical protein